MPELSIVESQPLPSEPTAGLRVVGSEPLPGGKAPPLTPDQWVTQTFRGNAAQPAPATGEPSPLAKFRDAVAENVGLKAVRDLDEGINALWQRITTGKGDDKKLDTAKQTLYGLAEGLANEPARTSQELRAFQDRLAQGDISGAMYHLAGGVPLIGAPAQQVAQDLAKGGYAEAAGHAVGLALPFAKPQAQAGVARLRTAVEPAVPIVRETLRGMKEGAMEKGSLPFDVKVGPVPVQLRGPKAPIGAAGGAYFGYKVGGVPGAITGAVVGGAYPIIRGGVRGARQALKERAAAAAESLRPSAPVPEPGVPPVIPPERQLAAPPNAIVTPAPELPPDASFVRGIPAQYAEVIPRTLRSNAEAEAAALALKQAMQESGTIERGAGLITAPEPEIPTAASVRASDRIAQTLHENGISSQDALLLDQSDWAQLTGPDAPPSLTRDAIVRLGELERAAKRQSAEPAPVALAERPPAPSAEEQRAAFGEARPPAEQAKPAPTASETRVQKLGKILADSKLDMSEIERIATTPDAQLILEDLAARNGLARPAAGEIPKIIEEVRKLRGKPKPPGAAAGMPPAA